MRRKPKSGRATTLSRLRALCLALPEAREKLSHGAPTWFAGKGKVYAMLDDQHHGAPHNAEGLPDRQRSSRSSLAHQTSPIPPAPTRALIL